MPLKPMKKLLFYSLFSFFFSISFSQEIAIYNFENLNLGVITGQDGWEFSTSLATNQNINWTVTNGTGSATINASGILNGQTPGTVTVTAYSMDGSNISGSTVITVLQPNVSSIIIQTLNGIADVFVNETLQISAVVQPANAANQTVSWSVINGTGTA